MTVISSTVQLLEVLFWTVTAVIGLAITLPVVVVALESYHTLTRESADVGLLAMLRSHAQADALRIVMHLSFGALGVIRLLAGGGFADQVIPNATLYWASLLVLMAVPLELIAVTLLARHARWVVTRAARDWAD